MHRIENSTKTELLSAAKDLEDRIAATGIAWSRVQAAFHQARKEASAGHRAQRDFDVRVDLGRFVKQALLAAGLSYFLDNNHKVYEGTDCGQGCPALCEEFAKALGCEEFAKTLGLIPEEQAQ